MGAFRRLVVSLIVAVYSAALFMPLVEICLDRAAAETDHHVASSVADIHVEVVDYVRSAATDHHPDHCLQSAELVAVVLPAGLTVQATNWTDARLMPDQGGILPSHHAPPDHPPPIA